MKTIAAVGLAISALAATHAVAQSQQGGLPAVAARVTQLEGTVGNLQAGLDAERAARIAADAALQLAVNGLQSSLSSLEAAVSGQASQIASLQGQVGALNGTVANLSQTVTSLSQSVSSLTTTVAGLQNDRTFAVFEHSSGFTDLNVEGFPFIEVVWTFLPAGNWIIYAHADVWRNDSNGASACHITSGPSAGNVFTTSSSAQETQSTDENGYWRGRFVLMSRASFAAPGDWVSVRCSSPASVSPSSSITAIRVNELSASQ